MIAPAKGRDKIMPAFSALLNSIRKVAGELRACNRGNVMVTFALATIPVIGAVGAAVDYSRANSAKAALQAAVDSAGLILSKEAQTLTAAQLSTKADAIVRANLHRAEITNLVVTPTFTTTDVGSFQLNLTASARIPTTLAAMFTDTMTIGTNAQVVWGMKRLELALALDNTGSMSSSGKMTQLKAAAKNLISTLKAAAKKPDDVKIAIIPFDTTVNLGTAYKDNDWFDIDSIDCNGSSSGTGCNSSNWKNHWEGCVRDRTYPYDTRDDAPTTTDTKFPVSDCGSLAKLLPLTNNWTALNAKIDEMKPNGNTNVTIGLVWAWHALTAGIPLSEASAPKEDLDKVIILLTDGDNTESWKNSNNSKVTSSGSIDARTALACTNAKAANIKIYAIRVINGNATLLKNCATRSDMYFDVQNSSQLSAVFSAIAQNLANLRLAK
jgi:Flp pilus assembly protein TadG